MVINGTHLIGLLCRFRRFIICIKYLEKCLMPGNTQSTLTCVWQGAYLLGLTTLLTHCMTQDIPRQLSFWSSFPYPWKRGELHQLGLVISETSFSLWLPMVLQAQEMENTNVPILLGILVIVMPGGSLLPRGGGTTEREHLSQGSEEFKAISPVVWPFLTAFHYSAPLSSLTRSTWFPRAVSRGRWNMKHKDSLIKARSPGWMSLIDEWGRWGQEKEWLKRREDTCFVWCALQDRFEIENSPRAGNVCTQL